MLIFMYVIGFIAGMAGYSIWLDIIANTDDLKVMRNRKYTTKYNKHQEVIDKAIAEQCKIIRIVELEDKLK